jgi:hypothetical protein
MAHIARWAVTLIRHGSLWALLVAIPPAVGQSLEEMASLSELAIETRSGRLAFQVELADTPETRGRGLMFRQNLPADQGMLFDFGSPRPVAMWMRNTFISLDMLFIDQNGSIEKIVPNTVPLSEEVIRSDGPVRAVLELRGGVAAELGIEPGDRVLHPLFSQP